MPRFAWSTALVVIAAVTLVPQTAEAKPKLKTGSLTQVGHEPLLNRGSRYSTAA